MPKHTCSNCDNWRHIRDEDFEAEDQDGEIQTWDGPHGECTAIDEFSTDKRAWLSAHLALKDEDGSWADHEEAQERCHADMSLITRAEFSCPLHSEK